MHQPVDPYPLRSYLLSMVPPWCQLHPECHQDGVGGCWGITFGYVDRKGKEYCDNCEYYDASIHERGGQER